MSFLTPNIVIPYATAILLAIGARIEKFIFTAGKIAERLDVIIRRMEDGNKRFEKNEAAIEDHEVRLTTLETEHRVIQDNCKKRED